MKTLAVSLTILLCLSAAQATVITFEDTGKTGEWAMTNSYQPLLATDGITIDWYQVRGVGSWIADHTPDTNPVGHAICAHDSAIPMVVTFSRPVEIPSFWVSSQWGGSSYTYKGLDASNNEVWSVTVTGMNNSWQELTLGAGKMISKLWADKKFAFLDDISVTPEPATMSLLGLGVIGLIRRK
jgi:hypothetical protein